MSFGKYRLKSPNIRKHLNMAQDRYNRLCSEVIIVQKADPDKLKAYRAKQRDMRKRSNTLDSPRP
jgi:hypothetical protein